MKIRGCLIFLSLLAASAEDLDSSYGNGDARKAYVHKVKAITALPYPRLLDRELENRQPRIAQAVRRRRSCYRIRSIAYP
jgi:hypothetical protein